MRDWQIVVGLEVHVQLATTAKIFSGAPTDFGAAPNTQACAVDLGLPGVLPVLNRGAVELAVRFGLAINAQINRHSQFDRKNYFYPDLPKGYQISQFESPIVGAGELQVAHEDGEVTVRINRAHLEEDAGKSIHDQFDGATAIDLNRCGMPLLEVVTEPDLRSASQAVACLRQIHALVRDIGICDGNMNEGSLRCDANVSVHHPGDAFGERTEIKNLNSFRFMEQAITFEARRQMDALESGQRVVRETRLFDADTGETRTMRTKEQSDDYRYFPDPDLLPVEIDEALIEAQRAALPELATARVSRYQDTYGLTAYDAHQVGEGAATGHYFETAVGLCGTSHAKAVANWIMGSISARLNRDEVEIDAAPVTAAILAGLIVRIEDNTLSSRTANEVFEAIWDGGDLPVADGAGQSPREDTAAHPLVDAVIDQHGLRQLSDTDELQALVAAVVADNPGQVAQYRSGKTKLMGFFVGQIMQATQGRANPRQVTDLLQTALRE